MDNNKKGVLLDKEELDEGGVPKEGMQEESVPKEGMSKEGTPKESMPKEGMLKKGLHREGTGNGQQDSSSGQEDAWREPEACAESDKSLHLSQNRQEGRDSSSAGMGSDGVKTEPGPGMGGRRDGLNAGMPQNNGRDNYGINPDTGVPLNNVQDGHGRNAGMAQDYGHGNRESNAGMPPYYAQGNRGQYADMPPGYGRTGQGHNMAPAYGYGGPGRNMHGAGGPMQEPGRPGYCYDRNTYPYPGQGDYGQEPEVPLTVGEWLINMLLMLIPCVNIILMLVWAFGDKEKRSKSNYYRARLIFWGILIGILFLWTCLYGMISWLL